MTISRTYSATNGVTPITLPSTTLRAPAKCATMSAAEIGIFGENLAAYWLEQNLGWTIIERNWHCRYGELDIIAFTPHRTLVFVEVKTRRSTVTGLPQESVTPTKQRHLRRAASMWFMDPTHRAAHNGMRFDVIALLITDAVIQFSHVPEAF